MQKAPLDIFDFNEIRPYNDVELAEAMQRLAQEPTLIKAMRWVYPGLSKSSIAKMFENIRSVDQFQEEISAPAMKVITQMTTSGLSFSNFEFIESEKKPIALGTNFSDFWFAQFPDDPINGDNSFALNPPLLSNNSFYIAQFELATGPARWTIDCIYPSLDVDSFDFFLPEGTSRIGIFSDEQLDNFISTFIGLDPFSSNTFINFFVRVGANGGMI